MSKIKIFCEGITDQVFIADCIELFYGFESTRVDKKNSKLDIKFSNGIEIIDVGGCSKLSNEIYISQLEDNKALNGVNVVIFDADYTELGNGNKGFDSCKQKLEGIKRDKNVDFDYFLWPNNNDDGIVEDLLRKLIPSDKEVVYNCIESHQACLSSLAVPNIRFAELKDKVGYYLHTVNLESRARFRNYKNADYWDLNHESIGDLKKLKSFLDTFLYN
ncbi:DUF3226 domain-containing protein [Flavobacterium difficile]|uniref:DUF4276 family protein n=1 Tax=Flavobacterium difficile TaxID=2709659 RepID=A0ABX0I879_9FLAO|nr:DUF3226 domain-containing protein [Flavobacterium difficile]NHM02413.1 hypothetical protein [Flavobacterium difficile]